MKVVIVRHGKSISNLINEESDDFLYSGAYDFDLTDEGVNCAKKLSNLEVMHNLDKIYSSTLKRAIDTAFYATDRNDIIIDDRIRERSLGDLENRYRSDLIKNYPYIFDDDEKLFTCGFDLHVPNGENYYDVSKRIVDFYSEKLLEDKGKTIGVFSHFHAIRVMLFVLEDLCKEEINDIYIPNTSPIVLEGEEIGKFKRLVKF